MNSTTYNANNELDFAEYLTALANLDYSAGYVPALQAAIDAELDAYYTGEEV